MNTLSLRRIAGLLLVIVPVLFTVCFTLLQMQFEYPDILRQPTADVLTKFQAGGPNLIAVWYVLTITAVLFIPVVVFTHRALAADQGSPLLWLATTFGVVAGLAQALGFLRWPFLVPHLAQAYLAPGASEAQRAAAALVFEAFHRYAGMAIGEHLGYLATSVWTVVIALLLVRRPGISRWLGVSGAVFAVGIAAGLLEPAGVEVAGTINATSYLAWAAWLVAVGVWLLTQRAESPLLARSAPALA
ncbi:MAG: DUF4386 domain-containing protein [Chloroflexales bacterium]|nr:DUF4386 domain-containing protein [Chloroflexales bacterium]